MNKISFKDLEEKLEASAANGKFVVLVPNLDTGKLTVFDNVEEDCPRTWARPGAIHIRNRGDLLDHFGVPA